VTKITKSIVLPEVQVDVELDFIFVLRGPAVAIGICDLAVSFPCNEFIEHLPIEENWLVFADEINIGAWHRDYEVTNTNINIYQRTDPDSWLLHTLKVHKNIMGISLGDPHLE
jgi:hypothetical protein